MSDESEKKKKGRPLAFPDKTWKGKFLQSLRLTPHVAMACRAARMSRVTAYKWRELDPEFAAAWQEALDASLDELEAVAYRKAQEGDSSLIMWLLRCHRPQVYRETNRTEHALLGKIVLIPAKAEGDE